MRLYSLLLFNKKNLTYSFHNLADISFIFRNSVVKVIETLSKEVVSQIDNSKFYIINQNIETIQVKIYVCHSDPDSDIVLISSQDYADRVAFNILKKFEDLCHDFDIALVKNFWNECQDITKIDKIFKVQQEIDQTKLLLLDSIDKLMKRGETLQDIMDKTETLAFESKLFKRKAKDLNACCTIL